MRAKTTFHVQNLFGFCNLFQWLNMGHEDGKRFGREIFMMYTYIIKFSLLNLFSIFISNWNTVFWNALLTSLMGKGVRKVKGCNGVFQKDCNMLLPLVRSWKYGCFMIGDGSYILTNLWGAQVRLVAASEAWRSNDKKMIFLNCVMLRITNARQKWVCDIMQNMMHWMFKFGHWRMKRTFISRR